MSLYVVFCRHQWVCSSLLSPQVRWMGKIPALIAVCPLGIFRLEYILNDMLQVSQIQKWNFCEVNLILSKTSFTWSFTCLCWRHVLFCFSHKGWIINIPILACHRYSEWREGSGNHSAKAFWTKLQWHECELRQPCFTTTLCVSVPFKVLSLVPPSLPTHEVQTLSISWTSVTRLPGTPCILPRLHYFWGFQKMLSVYF